MAAVELSSLSLDDLFQELKKLPDFEKYPYPEVFYEHFKVPKPKPSTGIMDCLTYQPPPSVSLNTNGKVELRPPAEGGVRELKDFQSLPVEVKKVNEETGELEDFPPPKPNVPFNYDMIKNFTLPSLIRKTDGDTQPDSQQMKLNPPKVDILIKNQPELDRSYLSLLRVVDDTAPDAPCHL